MGNVHNMIKLCNLYNNVIILLHDIILLNNPIILYEMSEKYFQDRSVAKLPMQVAVYSHFK